MNTSIFEHLWNLPWLGDLDYYDVFFTVLALLYLAAQLGFRRLGKWATGYHTAKIPDVLATIKDCLSNNDIARALLLCRDNKGDPAWDAAKPMLARAGGPVAAIEGARHIAQAQAESVFVSWRKRLWIDYIAIVVVNLFWLNFAAFAADSLLDVFFYMAVLAFGIGLTANTTGTVSMLERRDNMHGFLVELEVLLEARLDGTGPDSKSRDRKTKTLNHPDWPEYGTGVF